MLQLVAVVDQPLGMTVVGSADRSVGGRDRQVVEVLASPRRKLGERRPVFYEECEPFSGMRQLPHPVDLLHFRKKKIREKKTVARARERASGRAAVYSRTHKPITANNS